MQAVFEEHWLVVGAAICPASDAAMELRTVWEFADRNQIINACSVVKYNGYRLIVHWDGARVRPVHGHNWTSHGSSRAEESLPKFSFGVPNARCPVRLLTLALVAVPG